MIDNLIQVQAHKGPLFYARPGTSDEAVIREIWTENVYRMESGDCDGVVVDIGANIGAFSIYAFLHGAKNVIAVEPDLDNQKVFAANIADTSKAAIALYPCAAWFESGVVRFCSNAGGSRVAVVDGPELVPALSLEQILFSACAYGDIATMKIDIEGSEYPVISSTPREVLQRVRYLTMEFHATDAATFGALVAKLTETHCVQTLGSYERGGYLYCRRYQ